MYILSVLSGSSAHRCKCQRQIQKNGVFSRNLCKQQKPFFFLVYSYHIHIHSFIWFIWFIWCCISCVGSTDVVGIFSLLGQWITRIWCLLFTPCDSLSSNNPNGFYSGKTKVNLGMSRGKGKSKSQHDGMPYIRE